MESGQRKIPLLEGVLDHEAGDQNNAAVTWRCSPSGVAPQLTLDFQLPIAVCKSMKSVSSAVTNYVNQVRSAPDAPVATADCYIITLTQTGTILTWTNVDYPVTYDGYTFSCAGPLISGLKYKSTVGLEVDKQQITIAARPTDSIYGVQALQAIQQGVFDGASIERHRVFFDAPGGTVIGGVMLFHGRVATVDSVGRTRAHVTVASDLIVLDYDMPRNVFSATCLHTLYDSGCGVVRGTYSTNGAVGSGCSASLIPWIGASAAHAQGSLLFTSGAHASLRATVKQAVVGVSLSLMYPLTSAPSIGDAFTVAYGCDRTPNTCQSRFDNLSNYRGFPYVPPPQIAF
jgi:uncharacterized phage protein (TIGR02218 family)